MAIISVEGPDERSRYLISADTGATLYSWPPWFSFIGTSGSSIGQSTASQMLGYATVGEMVAALDAQMSGGDDVWIPPEMDDGMNGSAPWNPPAPPIVDPIVGGGAVVLASSVVAIAPRMLPAIRTAAQSLGVRAGARVAWLQLPSWFRSALSAVLSAAGISEILEFVFDVELGLPGGGSPGQAFQPGNDFSDVNTNPQTAIVNALRVGSWSAGINTFYRLSDGRQAVRRKTGVWTIWRPRKPVVLNRTGKNDRKNVELAFNILMKDVKGSAEFLRGMGWQVRRLVPPDSKRAGK